MRFLHGAGVHSSIFWQAPVLITRRFSSTCVGSSENLLAGGIVQPWCTTLARCRRSNPARGWEGTDRAGDWALGDYLLQLYKSQIPVIEQALETAALLLGSDKARGYCLAMICADFLRRSGRTAPCAFSLFPLLARQPAASISSNDRWADPVRRQRWKQTPLRVDGEQYRELHTRVLWRDGWRCQVCGAVRNLAVHHQQFRSRSGADVEQNLITLCTECHSAKHLGSKAYNFSQ